MLRRPAGDLFHHRRIVPTGHPARAVHFGAPQAVRDAREHAAQLGIHALQLAIHFPLLADIAGRHQPQGLRLSVQARDGQVDWNPNFLLHVAEQKSFLGMKHSGLFVGMAESLQTALNLRAEQIDDLQAQQFRARKTAQTLSHGIDVANLLRLRIEQEESVAGFFD